MARKRYTQEYKRQAVEKTRQSGISEIVAAIAVVFSIVYLAIEVRQNTSAVHSQTSQGLLEISNLANQQITADPQFAKIYLRAENGLDKLTDAERLQYNRFINSELNIWEHAFHSYLNGTMNENLMNAYDMAYRDTSAKIHQSRYGKKSKATLALNSGLT